MRYIKLTQEQLQSGKISSKSKGYTSGKKDPTTGIREQIVFCSALDFSLAFDYNEKREFIEI